MENCQEVSKQSLSVMWCGSASGELLPSMVVYKAMRMNCYKGWVQGGPKMQFVTQQSQVGFCFNYF